MGSRSEDVSIGDLDIDGTTFIKTLDSQVNTFSSSVRYRRRTSRRNLGGSTGVWGGM